MAEMACEKYLTDIHEMVKSKFSSAEEYADDAWTAASEYLEEISSFAQQFEFEWPFFGSSVDLQVDDHIPAMPDRPDLSIEFPDDPSSPSLAAITVSPVDVPSFNVIDPSIAIPDAPSVDWPSDPGEAPSLVYPSIPTKPSYDLPSAPVIEDITIPSPPDVELPSFEGELPIDDVDLPQSIFIYNETVYQSALRDAVSNKLLGIVEDGGTGLASDVEEAIWARARARKDLEVEKMYDEAEDYFASRGFILPPGALSGRLASVQREVVRAEQQINYEIMIEQAKLAQTNTHFAMTTAVQQEANIMTYVSGVATRALDAAKYTQEAAIAIFNACVAKYNQKLMTYQACAVVYESRIRAAGLVLDQYKTRLEGIRITADIQRLYVDVYKTQVSAVETLMNLYRTEMEAAKIQGEIERVKLEGFRAKVEAYKAKLDAITSKYNAYQAHIAGEAAKANVYEAQVRSYLGRVQGVQVEASINIAEAETKVAMNKNLIEAYRADIEKYNVETRALLGELETKGNVYGHDVGAYEADVRLAGVKIEGDISIFKAAVEKSRIFIEQKLAEVKMKLDAAMRLHEIHLEALKSGSNVTAQMAASALASVAAGAQLSYRGAYTRQDQRSEQYSGSL